MAQFDLEKVKNFYNDRFEASGDSVSSVGWGNVESQNLRFDMLLRNLSLEGKTVLDVGCGLGDLLPYLKGRFSNFDYIGLDISNRLIGEAKRKYKNEKNVSFFESDVLSMDFSKMNVDFALMSGTLTYRIEDNVAHAKAVLSRAYQLSQVGVASNFMSSYVDFENEKNFHYRPEEIFAFSKTLSPKVNLFHDYPLYEFTIQILKTGELYEHKYDR